jgi:hypothetical protein
MLYDDSVRVPVAAVEGLAILRVELESATGKKADVTDIPVRLNRAKSEGGASRSQK